MKPLKKIKLRRLPEDVRKIVREALADIITLDDYRGKDGADGTSINAEFGIGDIKNTLFLRHADGGVTERDLTGARGRRGRRGVEGEPGADGESINGEQGLDGRQGDAGPIGPQGPPGIKGAKGDKGDPPAHEFDGTTLRFRLPSGAWGRKVNLKGDTGGRGQTARAAGDAGSMANVQALLNRARSLAYFFGE